MTTRTLLFVPLGILLALLGAATAGKVEKRTLEVQGPPEPARSMPAAAASTPAAPRLTLSQTFWREAAEQYTRVIELNPQGPYVKEAAYAAALAWQNVVYEDDDDLRASPHGHS